LQARVSIVKDEWGISHIYAGNQHDLFFAQGWNAARDRLFQFEIWRRRATGTLAEIQGEKAFAHDRGARLLRYRGDLQAEMAHYHEDGEEIVTAFVDGVNAYIELTRREPERLPFEFELLGIAPKDWSPEIVLSRHNALTGGASTELRLAELINEYGAALTAELLAFERDPHLEATPGVSLEGLDRSLMADYTASRNPPPFDESDLATATQTASLVRLNATLEADNPFDPVLGSNNWVISGSRTASGSPIMANDPHRRIENPSLRYMVHLNAPGWNVIGAGEPVLPGVSIGHNDHGAWGLTIFRIDQEDLYVYRTNPDNPDQYWYQGAWRNMETESDRINVRGAGTREVTYRYTVHGPVLKEDPENHRAYAMRAVWLEQGAAPYLASLRMDQATSWNSFREACRYSGLPGENMVWAGRDGTIGWQAVGYTPVRFGWAGRLPVNGNGDYEWQGFVPIRAMPHLSDPEQGYYGTANHNNVPAGYPNIFSDFYSDSVRAMRLEEVLSTTRDHTVADSMRLQYDNKSITASVLVPTYTALRDKGDAAVLFEAWDFQLDRDSAAAALYDRWESLLLERLNDTLVSGKPVVSTKKLRDWVEEPPAMIFGDDPEGAMHELLLATMDGALAALREEQGSDPAQWRYGTTHKTWIRHPLSHLLDDDAASQLDLGPLPRGGGNTLNANRGGDIQRSGASFRMVVDTADWDSAMGTNTPGQSGDPRSPHYANLFDNWNRGEYFPMYFSRERIDAHASEVIDLRPD
jgi:penicillin amidase